MVNSQFCFAGESYGESGKLTTKLIDFKENSQYN
ncbi:hypothetical protein SAMN05421664_2404 [Chryseobacterium soldanellicola]|uniref:Uncharacterized protein n=1 Tax=Chryseobacterium soldanellicola TaxID=311333 RepID=A0A1H1DDZ9_9FLAO|nr:hypothetical protein SAMN05421664_2404 [Chryseobacterium soldanellicola]